MDCIFCKIISGEIPSYTIYEDEYFKVILDKFPSVMGHALVIPKVHCVDIFYLPKEPPARLFPFAKDIAPALKGSFGISHLNLLQNNGALAGQTVFHFHLHLIPRYENDNMKVGWDTISPTDEEFKDMVVKFGFE